MKMSLLFSAKNIYPMKHLHILILLSFLLQSCFVPADDDGDFEPQFFGNYEPVVMKRAEFENSTKYQNIPRPIVDSGKIYVKGNYIYINEVNRGFHVFDNSDPSNPHAIGFIKILGSSDLSIKEDVFYVNNATDLIAFTLNENEPSLTITKRIQNVFPQIWSPEGLSFYDLQADEVVVDWLLIE
jgi:hypothetical protein